MFLAFFAVFIALLAVSQGEKPSTPEPLQQSAPMSGIKTGVGEFVAGRPNLCAKGWSFGTPFATCTTGDGIDSKCPLNKCKVTNSRDTYVDAAKNLKFENCQTSDTSGKVIDSTRRYKILSSKYVAHNAYKEYEGYLVVTGYVVGTGQPKPNTYRCEWNVGRHKYPGDISNSNRAVCDSCSKV